MGVLDTTVESGAAPERLMRANLSGGAVPFPLRGVLGGWRDPWDSPHDHAQLRANAEVIERRQLAQAERLGMVWRQELTGTADACGLAQRSAGREPEHCLRPAGR